ncbi:MAG: hypothetical protein ACO3DQ_00920 [Cephaloticoccus sp.]
MPRSFPILGAVCLALASALTLPAADPATPEDVWLLAAGNQPLEAGAALERVDAMNPRARALAEAVLAMARPPLSDGDWARIEPVLAQLAQGDDAVAAQALYLQARMHQAQKVEPDLARATGLYRELDRRWPGSHWAQLGLVKLGLVTLYAGEESTNPRDQIAAAEALLAKVAEPALRRDLQLQIGWAALYFGLPLDEVLPHLQAADAVGGLMGITPEDLVIQLGELSLRAGRYADARHYFERFFAEYPTSTRTYNVRQRLREVDAALARQEGGG